MTRPLMATKLYVPKLRRGLVARPRLLERMGSGADARLTLVSAPAGFGKTTVLAAWLQEASAAGRRVAWLSLDAADNEPASFWTYVVTALQRAVPGVGASALELLASSPVPTELVLTTLLNELAAAPDEVWLVLDDYHLVDNHEINEGLAFLLEHLPAQVHVVLSTRADPDLPLARWRVRGELVEIRAADLRFTSDEANAYLNVATGLELAAADIAVLEERTEGWIAALQLAALSLQGRQDVSGFITRFAGDDRYIVDYLIEEVLRHQPAAVRDFLLQSAVLDRLTGPLCDAVTGRDDGSEMLVALERANLFIVALDDRREWYRYHHLFADVLRARMLSEQPDQVPLLHQRASQLVRAPRSGRGGGQARTGGARLRPGGPPDRAGRAGDPTPPAGSDDVRLAEGAARRHRPAQPGAECLLRRHADALRRPRRGRTPTRRRGTRAGGRPRRGGSPLADTDGAPDAAGDHRHLSGLARPGPR